MKKKQPVPIPDSFLSKILDHAEREYPRECCGMILSRNQNSFQFTRLVFCRNVQDRCHEEEPKRFPETSEKAYWVDPRQLLLLQKEMRCQGEKVSIIYHSHIDGPALFSTEDFNGACPGGRPVDPEIRHLIVAVRFGRFSEACLFHWNEQKKEYTI
jgi:proteasome lid subunit RPN8/RPN11